MYKRQILTYSRSPGRVQGSQQITKFSQAMSSAATAEMVVDEMATRINAPKDELLSAVTPALIHAAANVAEQVRQSSKSPPSYRLTVRKADAEQLVHDWKAARNA